MRSGDVVGSYRIRDSVGSGRTGEVHSAERSGEIFILKVLTPECSASPAAVSRYHQQAQQAGRLGHPSIERIVECGHAPNGSAFTSRPFVPALSLADFIGKNGAMSPLIAVQMMGQVAEALEHAHRNGLQHRALSTHNILVCLDTPELPRAVVVDFGISEIRADAEKRGLPPSGIEFRSPEQCLGGNRVDHRTDLYSLGCVLFACICGTAPFRGDERDVRAAHIRSQPPPISTLSPSTPIDLAALVTALLQKSVDNRPPDALSVARTLSDVARKLVPAPRPPAPAPPLRRPTASVPPPVLAQSAMPPGFAPSSTAPSGMAPPPAAFLATEHSAAAQGAMFAAPPMPPASTIETEIRAPIPPSAPPPVATQGPAPVSHPAPPVPGAEPLAAPTATGTARTSPPKRSHMLGLTLIIVGALAAAAAALYIAQSGSLSSETPPETAAAPMPATAPTEAKTTDDELATGAKETDDELATSTTPASPAGADESAPLRENGALDRPAGLITLTVESEPPGATLIRKKDGVKLGKTPFVYQVEPTSGTHVFDIELTGYKPASVSLPGDRDGVRQILLLRDKNAVITDPAPAPGAPLPERNATAARRAAEDAVKPALDPIDEERSRTRRTAEAAPKKKSKPRARKKSSEPAASSSDREKSGVVDYTAPPVPL